MFCTYPLSLQLVLAEQLYQELKNVTCRTGVCMVINNEPSGRYSMADSTAFDTTIELKHTGEFTEVFGDSILQLIVENPASGIDVDQDYLRLHCEGIFDLPKHKKGDYDAGLWWQENDMLPSGKDAPFE